MQYGKGETAITALSGVDLEVHAGELVAIMGASGSGKSTLLTIAGGLTTPTSGEVIVEGEWLSTMSLAGVAALRRRMNHRQIANWDLRAPARGSLAHSRHSSPQEQGGVSRRGR